MKRLSWFFRQSLISYKAMFGIMNLQTFLLIKFIAPISSMLFFCYLARHAYGPDNMADWVIGNAFATCVFPVFLGAGLILMRERGRGTLRTIIASPTSKLIIILSRSIMQILDAVLVCGVGLIVGFMVFDIDFSHMNIGLLILTLSISMISSVALGMAFGSLGLIVRDINMLMNIFITGLIILSGANIAIETLPLPMKFLSSLLPVSRGIEAGRLIYAGANLNRIMPLILEEVAVGIIYMIIAYGMFATMEYFARKHASIDLY